MRTLTAKLDKRKYENKKRPSTVMAFFLSTMEFCRFVSKQPFSLRKRPKLRNGKFSPLILLSRSFCMQFSVTSLSNAITLRSKVINGYSIFIALSLSLPKTAYVRNVKNQLQCHIFAFEERRKNDRFNVPVAHSCCFIFTFFVGDSKSGYGHSWKMACNWRKGELTSRQVKQKS